MTDGKDVPAKAARLRASFATGRTKSYEWRLGQLKALQRLMTEGRDELCNGIFADLRKDPFEGYLTELNLVETELQVSIDNLKAWMAPESKPTNLLNQPATSFVHREPYGVVLIIGAFNYPVMLTLTPLVGCIAAGNCALLKMPTALSVPASSAVMAKLLQKYLDPECFAVVEGDKEATSAVLTERWDFICCTGSSSLGKVVAEAAGRTLTPVLLEMGGQNPCVVDETATLDLAARRLTWGALLNNGQTCLRPDYIFLHEAIADKLRAMICEQIVAFYSANPQASPWLSRLPHAAKWMALAAVLAHDKAHIVHGGRSDEADRFIEPTVLFFPDIDAYAKSAAGREEIFGPLLPLIKYRDLDQVIAFINTREKPLSMAAFTSRKETADKLLQSTSSGSFCVNEVVMQCANMDLPFGGVGHSGLGAYHGKFSFDTFSHKRAVLWKPTYSFLDAPVRYPPYNKTTMALLRFIQTPRPAWWFNIPLKVALVAVLAALVTRIPKEAVHDAILALLG